MGGRREEEQGVRPEFQRSVRTSAWPQSIHYMFVDPSCVDDDDDDRQVADSNNTRK